MIPWNGKWMKVQIIHKPEKKKECILIKQYYCKTNHTNPSNYSHFPLKVLIIFPTDKYVRVEY